MSGVDWPSPEPSSREPAQRASPLPRVEDLPIAEQGYDREKVQEAFDAFYRHAAQLDATLRTLEGVEVFQRTAAELRAELRTIRGSGLSVGAWQSGAGYGTRQSVLEWSPSPAVRRVAAEFAFLILVGSIVGWAKWPPLTIVLVMALALAIVLLIEWVASRERAIPRAVAPAQAPALDEPAELEAAAAPAEPQQEGPDAMTIFGAPATRDAEPAEPAEEPAAAEPELEAAVSSDGHGEMAGDRHLVEEAEPMLDEASAGDSLDGGDSHIEPVGDSPREVAAAATALEDTAEELVFAGAGDEEVDLEAAAVEDVAPDDVALAAVAVEADTDPEVPLAAEEPKPDEDPGVGETPEPEEPKPDEEREVVEPKEPEQPEEEREEDLVAAAEELERAPEPETALGGVEPLETGHKRRRFRLFRRREAETPSEDEVAAESIPGEPTEPAIGSPDPVVQPGPDLEPPVLEPEEPDEPKDHVDPWEQAATTHEADELETVPEPESADAQPRRSWFRRAAVPEPEPVVQAELEPDAEEPPEPREPPVEVLAEQAASALERSRARRRPPRRARRR